MENKRGRAINLTIQYVVPTLRELAFLGRDIFQLPLLVEQCVTGVTINVVLSCPLTYNQSCRVVLVLNPRF